MKLCMGCMELYEEQFDICPCCGYEENTLPDEAFHLIPGTVIADRYIVGKVLGFGGFGVTYIGFDKELEKKVAIKEYLPGEFATRTLHQTRVTVYGGDKTEQFGLGMSKFVEEARKLAKFNEDTEIVNVYDTFMENDTAYIIMEYLEGESLKQRLEREGKLSLADAEQIILPIFRSLKSVHEEGIIHRDIAPDNIFITKDGRVKLLDFGAARYASATHSRSLTVIYKPGYAPEEQYQSRGEQGPWTDVYALAATLYKCITGVTPDTSLERKVKETLKEPSKLGVQISKNKETALLNALNIQVESRTKSTEAFLKEWESEGVVVRIVETFKKMDVGKLGKGAKIGILAGIAALAGGIVAVIGMGGASKITDSIQIAQGNARVPSVVNERFEEAVVISENAGIHMMQEDTRYDARIEKGRVLVQSVDAGKLMSTKESLMVVVSGGVRQIYVPKVEGSNRADALKLLEEEGFTYRTEEEYSVAAVDTVIRTSHKEGTQCDEGTEIVVYISKGIDPATVESSKEYVVEDYTNKTVEEVIELLKEYGISLDYSEQVESEEIEAGYIISQGTEIGTTLTDGDTVKVVMSIGIPMINVGDIIGWQYAERKEALEESGLVVEKGEEVYDNNRAKGLILSVETEDGEEVTDGVSLKKGTKLICKISAGPKPAKKATSTPKPTATPAHKHSWKAATCTAAKTCKTCGKTEGKALGHSYKEATCTEPKTCKVCGEKSGVALGHSYRVATCTEPEKCVMCGTTKGVALGHSFRAATCTEPARCVYCGYTDGWAAGHKFTSPTCMEARKCIVCGYTDGFITGHSWTIATCTDAARCMHCGLTDGAPKGHQYNAEDDLNCNICGYVRGYWSDWIDGGTAPIAASATKKVEERVTEGTVTQYRYRRSIWYNDAGVFCSSLNPPWGYTEGVVRNGSKTFAWDFSPWIDYQAPSEFVGLTRYVWNGVIYYTEYTQQVPATQTHYYYSEIIYY